MADDNLAMTVQASDPEVDFESIHDAFMESERGRWFLVEFARRNRHADTALLLAAIGRIESILLAQRAGELPAPRQDPAAFANPGAIKPDGDHESKSEAMTGVVRLLGESAARMRETIARLRDVSWSMREQGDMRCEVIDRQAVEIAQTAASFDALRETLGPAGSIPDIPPPPAPRAPKAEAQTFPLPREPGQAAEPPPAPAAEPATNFTFAPLFDALPPERNNVPEAPAAPPEAGAPAPAAEDDPFADMLFETDISPAEPSGEDTMAPAMSSDGAAIEGPFDSSQAKRLTRLINLFAGARDAAAASQPEQDTPDAPAMDAVTLAAEAAFENPPAEAAAPIARPEEPKAPGEPADFLLEPWPHASVAASADPVAETPPATDAEPASPAKTAIAPAVSAASLFPMTRAAPGDPLAPIVALSDEEKIALFS